MAACVAGIAGAVEAKARVTLDGTLASGGKDKAEFLKVKSTDQKDSDALVFEVYGEKAGAAFQLWYNAPDGAVQTRGTKIWFKPHDMVKLSVGAVGNGIDGFCETLDWWKVGSPFAVYERDWTKHPQYISNGDVDGYGLTIEVTPISGLKLTAGVAPGKDTSALKFDNTGDEFDFTAAAWGATARYQINDSMAVGAGWRDNGSDSWKVARAGFRYEANGLTAFLQPIFGLDYIEADENYALTGIVFDNFVQYATGAFKVALRVPVTVRLGTDTTKEGDPSYLEFRVRAEYGLGSLASLSGFTPYLNVETNNEDDLRYSAWILNSKNFSNSINLIIQPGATFSVGNASFDISVKANVHSKFAQDYGKSDAFTWAVPFNVALSF